MYIKSLSTIAIATAIGVTASASFAMKTVNEKSEAAGKSYQMLAETQGMERRGDRRDVRQDARQEEGPCWQR